MTIEGKKQLRIRWIIFHNRLEELMVPIMFFGDGAFFILFLPIWILLLAILWIIFLIGVRIIKMIPTKD